MYKLSEFFGRRKPVRSYLNEAYLLSGQRNYSEAIQTLLRGTKMHPDNFTLFSELGRLCARAHEDMGTTEYDALGLWAFKSAYEIDPGDLKNLDNYARFLRKKGRHEEAQHRYAEIVFLTTSDLDADMLVKLGSIYENSGQYRLALACLGKARVLRRGDNAIEARLRKLEKELDTVFDMEDWEEAESYFRQILETGPGYGFGEGGGSEEVH